MEDINYTAWAIAGFIMGILIVLESLIFEAIFEAI